MQTILSLILYLVKFIIHHVPQIVHLSIPPLLPPLAFPPWFFFPFIFPSPSSISELRSLRSGKVLKLCLMGSADWVSLARSDLVAMSKEDPNNQITMNHNNNHTYGKLSVTIYTCCLDFIASTFKQKEIYEWFDSYPSDISSRVFSVGPLIKPHPGLLLSFFANVLSHWLSKCPIALSMKKLEDRRWKDAEKQGR